MLLVNLSNRRLQNKLICKSGLISESFLIQGFPYLIILPWSFPESEKVEDSSNLAHSYEKKDQGEKPFLD